MIKFEMILGDYNFKTIQNSYEASDCVSFFSGLDEYFNYRIPNELYANKLFSKGLIIVAYKNGDMVGVVGFYVNDSLQSSGYLSMIGRAPGESGLGQLLLEIYHFHCRINGLRISRLEVNKSNDKVH